jgi:diguanylate cyclase (GGDEF)-like protein
VVIFAVSIVAATSVLFIQNNEHRKSDQLLLLLCETGETNLDYYFNSVQKSVERVASFTEADIDGLDDKQLASHMNRVGKYFDEMAYKTNGVLTYYYRIDPEVSKNVKGFWYTNLDGNGFVEHKVTDITLYDTNDTSKLVWFTVPKYKGEAIWLSPYITDNLNKRVISYNVPIYYRGDFVGVVGIEIDYTIMAEQVDSIKLYSNGYAFLSGADGSIFYHPHIDVTKLTEGRMPVVPDGLVSDSTFISYKYNGVEKVGAWLPLSNGMRLVVSTPASEAEGDWMKLVWNIIIVAVEVLVVASIFTMFYTKRLSKPIKELTRAAQMVDDGNYNFALTYKSEDEIGRLTNTFIKLANNMKLHINDLSSKVFVDALTSVSNKAAYNEKCEELQKQIDENPEQTRFAIGIFDCNNLKKINDQYGHDKGDIYLQCASSAIEKTFKGCPVFRIGGDEFAVILTDENYQNRELLISRFDEIKERVNQNAVNQWETVDIAMGCSEYIAQDDQMVEDVARRADRRMYENKASN